MDMSREVGGGGRDGGISQGISGISPRGGLVNCSLGRPEGRGKEREEEGEKDAAACGCASSVDTEVGSAEGTRGKRTSRERERGHKSRRSYGLKEAYWPTAVADAFAEKKKRHGPKADSQECPRNPATIRNNTRITDEDQERRSA